MNKELTWVTAINEEITAGLSYGVADAEAKLGELTVCPVHTTRTGCLDEVVRDVAVTHKSR